MNNNLSIFHSDDDETMMILTTIMIMILITIMMMIMVMAMMMIIVMMMKCSSILCQQIKLNVTRDPGPGYPEMQGSLLSQIRIVSA